jgi:adenylate cyclase
MAPYGPPFGRLMRSLGFGPWIKNPSLCGACMRRMERHGGGATVRLTMLFADLRGSTGLAREMTPEAYRQMVNNFYAIAARDVRNSGGVVNKYLGDGVFALFVPGFSGAGHAQMAIDAARRILIDTTRTSDVQGDAGSLPVGIGVHTGEAFVGFLGTAGDLVEFTALGDAVNVAQRLSSAANSRELLISDDAQRTSGSGHAGMTRRALHLKGIEPTIVAWSEQSLT